MIKLSMNHIDAICHAELLMDACQLVQGAHKLRYKIENDLLRLAELKLYIIQVMNPPTLDSLLKPGNNGDTSTRTAD